MQNQINKGIIPECRNIEIISESYDFLLKGFEKYGYTLQIDTNYNLPELIVRNQVIGYFDLVNNTDSIIKSLAITWSIDNMAIGTEIERDSLFKPGDSIKIKYTIFKGLTKIANTDFDFPIILTKMEDSIITNKKKYIDNLTIAEKLKNSKAYFRVYNKLNICGKNINIIFMIPVKYIKEIQLL